MVKNADSLFEETTALPMTGPIQSIIPRKGVVLLGDAAGFMEISGGSGLVSSIRMAKFWSTNICDALDCAEDPKILCEDDHIEKLSSEFRETDVFQRIVRVAERNIAFRKYLFVELNTREKMLKNWERIRMMLTAE